jgi:archaellum component FlaF (FlaF/FlaG flagellin family)
MLSKQPNKKPQVSPKEQMSPNTHNILLIVIIVILVGVLGVTVGYIYFESLNHPNTIIINNTQNSTNQTNANASTSTNSDNSQTTTNPVNNNNGYISVSDAESIAIKYAQTYEDPQGLPVTLNTNSNGFMDQHLVGPDPDDFVFTLELLVGTQLESIDINATSGQVINYYNTG